MIIELTANNFPLLSHKEQTVRIGAYASLLNSLSFPIQIVIRNKRMDITSYLKELENIITKTTNPQLKGYIEYYYSFVQEMVTVNTVLNKAFYVVLSYSALEGGTSAVSQMQLNNKSQLETFAQKARHGLEIKATNIINQLQRFSVSAKVLEKEDLMELFYDLYNDGHPIEFDNHGGIMTTTVSKGGEQP